MKETKILKYGLLFIVGFGIGLIGSEVYAKQQSSVFTTFANMCKPTGSSQNDTNAETNCQYIYGKLEYLQHMLERNTSYITNIHSDLEKYTHINTPLDPN